MRKVKRLQWIVGGILLLQGCAGPDAEVATRFTEPATDSVGLYVRQPLVPTDTAVRAQLNFAKTEYDFGTVRAGRTVRHRFAFTSSGPEPVQIKEVTTSCGCTAGRYPTGPIDVGTQAAIEVIFATEGTVGQQRRPVVVRANTVPAQTTLYLSGEVLP